MNICSMHFRLALKADQYSPNYPTAIERAFNQGLEMTMEEVEALFVEVLGSPLFAQVGQLISARLGQATGAFRYLVRRLQNPQCHP
jgi:hypothetical protein